MILNKCFGGGKMTVEEKIFQVYQQFYDQRSVLQDAPLLTINPVVVGLRDFPVQQALVELNAMASYLLGRSDISRVAFEDALNIVDSAYADQPFWRDLLLNYLDAVLSLREEEYARKGGTLQEKTNKIISEIAQIERKRTAVINFFAQKIQEAQFHVDGRLLVYNYIKMLAHDADKAKVEIATNPAYFAPIQTKDSMGRDVLTPSQAIEENKRLGKFLKKILT
jgi:hypothetical protein